MRYSTGGTTKASMRRVRMVAMANGAARVSGLRKYMRPCASDVRRPGAKSRSKRFTAVLARRRAVAARGALTSNGCSGPYACDSQGGGSACDSRGYTRAPSIRPFFSSHGSAPAMIAAPKRRTSPHRSLPGRVPAAPAKTMGTSAAA